MCIQTFHRQCAFLSHIIFHVCTDSELLHLLHKSHAVAVYWFHKETKIALHQRWVGDVYVCLHKL